MTFRDLASLFHLFVHTAYPFGVISGISVTSGYMKQLPWPAIFETAATWHDNANWQNLLQQLCENSLVCGLCPLPSW
jgi:hypothetical protein